MPIVKSAAKPKPKKPRPDFPLFPHATGRWCKKIRGQFRYFGPWDDPDAALQKYLDQRDDLHAGRTPRVNKSDGLYTRDLCNRFLTAKRQLLDGGELAETTFRNYFITCGRVIDHFGKSRLVEDLAADDFATFRAALSKTLGPSSLAAEVRQVRILFKWAHDSGLMAQPVRYGQSFRMPSKKTLRLARQANGPRMFEAVELRTILDAADVPLRATMLLGVNCGLGNTDIANLPQSALDLDNGWIDFPRPKTGIERRCPLWPETVEAVRLAIAQRPTPKDAGNNGLVFITPRGERWVMISDSKKRTWKDSLGKKFYLLLKALDLKRRGLNFYGLRHTFRTVADESKDQPAIDHVMGHARDDMASLYRERISDERLQAVTAVVHSWLFGS